jgi:hypothetical protein
MGSESGKLQTLGQRIFEAAHVAVAVHLFESLLQTSQHYGRRIGIGGAGPVSPGGGADDSSAVRRPSRESVVTDDEPVAHSPGAAGNSRRPPQYSDGAD